jgi:hypothetical protein
MALSNLRFKVEFSNEVLSLQFRIDWVVCRELNDNVVSKDW